MCTTYRISGTCPIGVNRASTYKYTDTTGKLAIIYEIFSSSAKGYGGRFSVVIARPGTDDDCFASAVFSYADVQDATITPQSAALASAKWWEITPTGWYLSQYLNSTCH
jgi:hypothetical protein